jgi:hypothetical protein
MCDCARETLHPFTRRVVHGDAIDTGCPHIGQ